MRRYKNPNDKLIYQLIYNETKSSINENRNFDYKSFDNLDESFVNIVIDAMFDAIGFNGDLRSNKSLNESIINSGKKVNLYNSICEGVKLVKKTKKPIDNYIDEGLIAGALGALAGISFGPAIGKALCNALGIGKGVLYDLMTSKLVNSAVCTKLGLRF